MCMKLKDVFCPVKYFKKWQASTTLVSARKPAFLKPNGLPFRGKELNDILETLLSPYIDYKKTNLFPIIPWWDGNSNGSDWFQ